MESSKTEQEVLSAILGRCVLGIDPGPFESCMVLWDPDKLRILDVANWDNERCYKFLAESAPQYCDLVAIERLRPQGKAVASETFDTVEASARMWQAAVQGGCTVTMVTRRSAVRHVTGLSMPAHPDKLVRARLIDRFGRIGTEKDRGPLFGMKGPHAAAALAVAVTAVEGGV